MSRKDAMYFARQAERRARHEPSAQVMDMRYHIDALEAKLERLEKAAQSAVTCYTLAGVSGGEYDFSDVEDSMDELKAVLEG